MFTVSEFEWKVITLIADFNDRLQKNPHMWYVWIIDSKADEKVALLAEAVLKDTYPRIQVTIDKQRLYNSELWERCVGLFIYYYKFHGFANK